MASKQALRDLLDRLREQLENGDVELAVVGEVQTALVELQEQLRQEQLQRQYQAALELARQAGYESIEEFAAAARGASVPTKTGRSHVAPLYRDPRTGLTWSGRGKPAGWLLAQAQHIAETDATSVEAALDALKAEYKIRRT